MPPMRPTARTRLDHPIQALTVIITSGYCKILFYNIRRIYLHFSIYHIGRDVVSKLESR